MIEWHGDSPLIEFWLDGTTAHLDVRPLLETGGEPYREIMSCVQQLDGDDRLVVHAIFQPKPLIRQLERQGFLLTVVHEGPDHWTLDIVVGPPA